MAKEQDEFDLVSIINDSGLDIEQSMEIDETFEELQELPGESQEIPEPPQEILEEPEGIPEEPVIKNKYVKPKRPCLFCKDLDNQTQLKRHILSKHKKEPKVIPLFKMSSKEQDAAVAVFRREAIRMVNINIVNANMTEGFLRERAPSNSTSTRNDIPVMCSGCKGFFSPTYKSRHFEKCTSKKSNLMLPMVAAESIETYENFSDEFKELLNTLLLDDVANYLKTDQKILMLGYRSFGAIKRRADKKN